jgi:prephenate dehydratase
MMEGQMGQRRRELHLHTLGPTGTNCEAAAYHWLKQRGCEAGRVLLYETLEKAIVGVLNEPHDSALVGCVVYPRLHEIIFKNLDSMSLRECFVMPTHRMVLAGTSGRPISTVLSHPAPVNLIDLIEPDIQVRMVSSNAAAAQACARGDADACITTIVAAEASKLEILKDFGPIPMGFTIHAPHGTVI